MDVTATWYRAQASECAERAEKASDQHIKTINRQMAESWLRLAELVEKYSGESPIRLQLDAGETRVVGQKLIEHVDVGEEAG